MITKFKLFENPNAIFLSTQRSKNNSLWSDNPEDTVETDITIDWNDEDTFPFGFDDNGNFIIGDWGDTHDEMLANYDDDYGEDEDPFWGRRKLSGRVFFDSRVITFWDFPENKEELKWVVQQIESEKGIKIWGKDWYVEINISDDDRERNWGSWRPNSETTKMVPLEDYKGSKERSEEELRQQHILSPMMKKEKPKGWKPKKYKYQLPGESEVEARWRVNKYMYQESKNEYEYILIEYLNALPENINIFLSWKDASTYIINRIHEEIKEKDNYKEIKNNFDANELVEWYNQEYNIFGREFLLWRVKPTINVKLNKELRLRKEFNKYNL